MRVTGSKLALLAECGWWARDGVAWSPQTSEAASFGTQIHAMCETMIEGRALDSEISATREVFDRVVAPWIRENKRAGWRAEIPFAIDVASGTARELPKTTHRDYSSAGPSELCLTTDLCYCGEDADGTFAAVDDFKWSGFHGDAMLARAQLAAQAVAVADAWGVDRVRARAIRISEDRLDDITEVYWFDMFELEIERSRIAELIVGVPSAEPVEGTHCKERWCPALASCPKTTALVAQVIPPDSLARKEWRFTPQIESPDHLERILAMRRIVEEYLDRVKRAAVEYVANGPVRTSDGREIKQTFRTMTRTNQSALLDLAKQLGATDEQLAGCARTSQEPTGVRVSAKRGRAA